MPLPCPRRPLASSFGALAAVTLSAGLLYSYSTPSATVFGRFRPRYLRLESVEDLSHNIRRLRFALPNRDDLSGLPLTSSLLTASWPAGSATPVLRPYTPVSAASEAGHVDLVVKKYHGGKQSTHLHSLAPGDELLFVTKLPGPVWPRKDGSEVKRVLLIAGGAGVTPCWQLLRGMSDGEAKRVDVVYGVEAARDAVLAGEMAERGARVVVVSKEGGEGKGVKGVEWRKGRVTGELLREVVGEGGREGEIVYVCGPGGMEEALVGGRKEKGILGESGYGRGQVVRF